MRTSLGAALRAASECALVLAVAIRGAAAQTPTTPPLTIGAAVETASRQSPSAIEARAHAAATAAAVEEAKSASVPRLDAIWQTNRATRNNVFGLSLPQSVVPPVSGPVLESDRAANAWGSAAGLLFSWEVFDFGRRAASVDASRAQASTAEALAAGTRLDAGVAAADAYLAVLGADQAVTAAGANVTRLEVLQRSVKALVDTELRPGADLSRLDAELAAARNRLILAEQAAAMARLRLAAAMGLSAHPTTPDRLAGRMTLDPGNLLRQEPGGTGPGRTGTSAPPAVQAAAEAEKVASANLAVASRLYRPKIVFQAALATRGSGAHVNGTTDNAQGLWPNTPNWATGLTVMMPLLDFTGNGARVRTQTADVTAAHARYEGSVLRAHTETLQADLMFDTARRMAANIPPQLTAARQTEAQSRSRYDAGLTGIAEVADAQRLLAEAEADAAFATLALWRARLAEAAASGDLSTFLGEAAAPTGPLVRR